MRDDEIAHQRVVDPACAVAADSCSIEERAAFALIENRDPDRYDPLFQAAGPIERPLTYALNRLEVFEYPLAMVAACVLGLPPRRAR